MRHLSAGESRLSPRPRYRAGRARPRAIALFGAAAAVLAVALPATAQAGGFQFAPQAEFGTEAEPSAVAVADLNGDGKPDLVVANKGSENVSVLLGNGSGTFAAQKTDEVGKAPTAVAVADLNGDKIPDLIVANSGSNSVSVLLGKGDGTFEAQKVAEVGEAPSAVAVADFNGDKAPDLVLANRASKNVSVLLGKGDGTFEAQKLFETELAPSALAVADLGNGKLDLVAANSESNSVSVLLGNGDGTFQEQKPFAAEAGPSAIAIADLNGDGKPDLAVANSVSNNVSVLLGNGNGSFAGEKAYGVGATPNGIATGELNGDGKRDLVASNSGANTVSVLLGKGDGTFAGKADFGTGKGPAGVAVSDLNADGKADIVTPDSGANKASVLLNTSVAVFEAGPASLTFPNTLFGTKSAAQKVTVTNSGSAPLTIGGVAVTGNFTASGCTPPLILAPGASCAVSVVFGPKGYGKLTGELTITSSVSAKKIALSGTGLPPLPIVNTGSVGEINGFYATLTGTIISQGKGTFYFQYGPTLAYGTSTPVLELASSFTPQLISASVPLNPGTTYHYRLVATNLAGTVFGRDQVFTVPPEAPLLKILRHGRLGAVLKRGLPMRVQESCSATLTLKIFLDAKTARAAHLVGKKTRSRVTIGTLRVTLGASKAKRVTLAFARSARRHLAGMHRLRLLIEGTAATSGVTGEAADVNVQLNR